VVVQDPEVRALLLQVVDVTADGASLFPYSAKYFRAHFKKACRSLGLKDGYVPHSLRHGGATRDHMRGKNLEDILARGRWASTKSARHYVQAGRALLLACKTPAKVAHLGESVAAALVHSFSLPQMH
jgi:integrase